MNEEASEEEPKRKRPNFWMALGSYAGLAVLAWLTLDGPLRAAVWLLLGALTILTCTHRIRERQ